MRRRDYNQTAFRTMLSGEMNNALKEFQEPRPVRLEFGNATLDCLYGDGLHMGAVNLMVGHNQDVVSSVMANAAIALAENRNVVYVPLRDCCTEEAIGRLLSVRANVPRSERLTTERRVDLFDAAECLNDSRLGLFWTDSINLSMLSDRLLSELGEGSMFVQDAVLVIDGLEMLDEDLPLDSLMRQIKYLLCPSSTALVSAYCFCDDPASRISLDGYCNASTVVSAVSDGGSSRLTLRPEKGCEHGSKITEAIEPSGLISNFLPRRNIKQPE